MKARGRSEVVKIATAPTALVQWIIQVLMLALAGDEMYSCCLLLQAFVLPAATESTRSAARIRRHDKNAGYKSALTSLPRLQLAPLAWGVSATPRAVYVMC